jgi:hypothetical protein
MVVFNSAKNPRATPKHPPGPPECAPRLEPGIRPGSLSARHERLCQNSSRPLTSSQTAALASIRNLIIAGVAILRNLLRPVHGAHGCDVRGRRAGAATQTTAGGGLSHGHWASATSPTPASASA